MTPEERDFITTEIKLAVIEGLNTFSAANDLKIAEKIRDHVELCTAQRGIDAPVACSKSTISPAWLMQNWRTVAVAMVIISWTISSVFSAIKGTPQKFTPEMVRQIAQQVQQEFNPVPIKYIDPNMR